MTESAIALLNAELQAFVAAHAASITEPVFFVCVAYDIGEGETLPTPVVGLGLDRERRASKASLSIRARVEKRGKDDGLAEFYNPANYSLFESKAFHFAPSKVLKHALAAFATDEDGIVAFYESVANELADVKWPFALTDDFCVFATDLEQCYWEASFRRCVAPELRGRLARDRWIPAQLASDG